MTELETEFHNYITLVKEAAASVKSSQSQSTEESPAFGVPTIASAIRNMAQRCELSAAFKRLAKLIGHQFGKNPFDRLGGSKWESHTGNFLRLSGIYGDVYAEREVDGEESFALLCDAFQKQIKQTFYAPIEAVEFSSEIMEFGDFSIRRFSYSELDTIFKQELCKLFYPASVIDTAELSDYWFLVCPQTSSDREEPGWDFQSFDFAYFLSFKITFSTFRQPVRRAFRRLILYPWATGGTQVSELPILEKVESEEGPFRFYLPFILSSSDSLIETPHNGPDLSVLATEPSFDQETGEEIGRHRLIEWYEDSDADFVTFIKRADLLVQEVENHNEDWPFAETALSFLEKAFLRGDEEQLLWHITTIEAILGEKVDAGLTTLLKSRVGDILGKTAAEQKQVRKNFDALYSLRSDLVHGNADISDKTIYLGQLSQAREIARSLTLWLLQYLAHIRKSVPDGSELPSRESILSLIDSDQKERSLIATILKDLPDEFPHVASWPH